MLLTVFKNHSLAAPAKVAPTCAPPAALLFTASKLLLLVRGGDSYKPLFLKTWSHLTGQKGKILHSLSCCDGYKHKVLEQLHLSLEEERWDKALAAVRTDDGGKLSA